VVTSERPLEKLETISNFGWITKLPFLSMKPYLPLNFILASPSEKSSAKSNFGGMT